MSRFDEISDVSFIGDITVADLKKEAIEYYNEAYESITGSTPAITDNDKAILYTVAEIFSQLAETANEKGKQNLLKYATGEYLDNLALLKGLTRKTEENAIVTVRFTLSAVRENIVAIPEGTRVTSPAGKVYFATNEYTEIPSGDLTVDISCTSTTGGSSVNDFEIGEINTLVDPIAYVSTVSNIEEPTGGSDAETDDEFAERIFNYQFTAGTEDAYIYYTKSYSTSIEDVKVKNPSDAQINIYILMDDRSIATDSFIEALTEYLNVSERKAITDQITVYNVERVEYTIDVSYKIYDSNISRVTEIQTAVNTAVEEYKEWQAAKIGRGIDPQELLARMNSAGARNIVITTPQTTVVDDNEIAYCTSTNITYSGTIEE